MSTLSLIPLGQINMTKQDYAWATYHRCILLPWPNQHGQSRSGSPYATSGDMEAPRAFFHLIKSTWPSKATPRPFTTHTCEWMYRFPLVKSAWPIEPNQHGYAWKNVFLMLPQTSTLPISEGWHFASCHGCLWSIHTSSWEGLGENVLQSAHLWICTRATLLPAAPYLG